MQVLSGKMQSVTDPRPLFTVSRKEGYVLYVDDDADDRENFRYALEQCKANIDLATAVDADDAIAKLATQKKPVCIYLDINMPRMNGIELLKLLKSSSDHAGIPVIIFSTTVDARSAEEAMNLGAADVVVKPSSLKGLLDHIYTSLLTHFQIPPSPSLSWEEVRLAEDNRRIPFR